MRSLLLKIIRFYQKNVSPYFPARCRFTPTCSQYALEAIQYHGALKGSYLACKRLCKCHPFYKGDVYDPVPKLRRNEPQQPLSYCSKEENQ